MHHFRIPAYAVSQTLQRLESKEKRVNAMIIDASLQPGNRVSCCGGYPFPPQPSPPVPPQPVRTEPDTLQLSPTTAQTGIANGAAIPLTGVVRQTGNGLRYDPATRAVMVEEAGVYTFVWQVLVQNTGAEAPVIQLQSLSGQRVLGTSGAPAEVAAAGVLLTGSAVAALPEGSAWVLVNASGAPLNIPAVGTAPAVFAASMTVSENGSSQNRINGFLM